MSAGGGLLFGVAGRNGLKIDLLGFDGYAGLRSVDIGGFVFFDAKYAELDFYFAYGRFSPVFEKSFRILKGVVGDILDGNMTQLGFSLVGKYPIDLGKLTVFPLAGISYNIVLSMKNDNGDSISDSGLFDATDFSQFGFLLGAGLDVDLTKNLYLRGELALQIRLPSKAMKDMADFADKEISDLISGLRINSEATVGLGPRFKLGVGYRF